MRMRTLLVAGLAVLTAAMPATAKPQAQIVDPKNDFPVAVGDIHQVTFFTEVKGSKENLLIEMVVGAAPSTQTPFSYGVTFTSGECAYSAIYFGHPFEGVFTTSGVGCSTGNSLPEGDVRISGAKILWTMRMSGVLKRGAVFEDLRAQTMIGGAATGGVNNVTGDRATGSSDWVSGSDCPKRRCKK